MRFPSIRAVSADLREINDYVDGGLSDYEGCDVRLQVYPDGTWYVRWGLSDYDQDHRGFWGASSIPGGRKRFRASDVARDLIEQAREAYSLESDE